MTLPMIEKVVVNSWTHKIFYHNNKFIIVCSYYGIKDFQNKLFAIRNFSTRKNPKSYIDVLTRFKNVFPNIEFCQ